MNVSFSLFRLQSLDTQRFQIARKLSEIDSILSQDEQVQAALQARNQAESSRKQAQDTLDRVLRQVTEKKLKLELTNAQLFGGKIHNLKELQDLQAEGEALKRTISRLEDEQLDAMISLEAANNHYAETEQACQRTIDQKNSQNSLLLGEKRQLDLELPRLNSQREALLATMPQETVELYLSLLKTKAGRAVVEVVDDCCSGCGVSLSPGDIQAARSPATLARCKTCGRIIYKS